MINQSQRDLMEKARSLSLVNRNLQNDLDHLTELTAKICGTSIALITLWDGKSHVVKSTFGFDSLNKNLTSEIWDFTLQNKEIVISENIGNDDRFVAKSLFTDNPKLSFYAGCQLKDSENKNIGIVSIIDKSPNCLSNSQKESLALLSEEISSKLTLLDKNTAKEGRQNSPEDRSFKFRTEGVLNSVSDSIVILDQKGTIIKFNSAAEKVFQYSKKEILGQLLSDTILPDTEYGKYHQPIHRYFETGNTYITGRLLELSARKKDGTEFPVELILNHIQDTNPPLFIGILRDITERRSAQIKLRQTLTNLNIGQQLANVGSWKWEPQSGKVEWSNKVYDIYDINIIEKPSIELFLKRVHPEDREIVQKALNNVMEFDEFHDFEHRLKIPGKDIKWVRHSGEITFDAGGNATKVNGAVQDITKQKETQLKLEREKKLSDKIINSLPVSFFMFDRDGNAIRWNDEFRSSTGYSEQQIAYMSPIDYFPDHEQLKIENNIDEVFQSGESTAEANLKNIDGELIPHILSATLFESKGDPYMIGTGQNIAELKQYQIKLKESLNEKEILLSEIHHRVKNNLAIISSLLQLEIFEAEHTQSRETLQNSQMRIQSMATVHELLYESDNFISLPFNSFIEKIIKSIQNIYEHDGLEIEFKVQATHLKLNVNQAIPFSLIINELLTNSYKHAFKKENRGTIDVKLQKSNDTIFLQIEDNGSGLPAGFSLQESNTIGFTLIKMLCKQLEADIEIQSNTGTKVSLYFQKDESKGASSSL